MRAYEEKQVKKNYKQRERVCFGDVNQMTNDDEMDPGIKRWMTLVVRNMQENRKQ